MTTDMGSWQRLAFDALPVLLDAALKGTALLAAAGAAVLAMRKRSAAARQVVWLLALAALLALPVASAALPGWQVLPGWARIEMPPEPAGLSSADSAGSTANSPPSGPFGGADPAGMYPAPAMLPDSSRAPGNPRGYPSGLPAAEPGLAQRQAPGPANVLAGTTANNAARAGKSWRTLLVPGAVAAWLAGTLVCLLPLVLGRLSLWRLARRSSVILSTAEGRRIDGVPAAAEHSGAGPWAMLATRAARAVGLRRHVQLLHSDAEPMPMVWGVLRPRLLIPAEADDWPADRRWVVLLHELAHVKRWDCATKLLAHVACACYWFNPFCWIAFRLMQREAEAACDDLVLSSGHRPSDYAQHLLEIASGLKSGMLAAYSSIAMARRSKLEGRLLAILDGQRNRRALTRLGVLIAAVLVAAIAVPLAVLKATGPEKPAAENASTQVATGARKFPAFVVFVNNKRYGPTNGSSLIPQGAGVTPETGNTIDGHPGAVSEVEWKFLRTTDAGDEYEVSRRFPADTATPNTEKKTVTYNGKPLTVFQDDVQRVLFLSPADFKSVQEGKLIVPAGVPATQPAAGEEGAAAVRRLNDGYKLEALKTYHKGEAVEVRLHGLRDDRWQLDEDAFAGKPPKAFWRLDGRDIPAGMSLFGGTTNEVVGAQLSEGKYTLQHVIKRLPLVRRDLPGDKEVFDEVTSNVAAFVVLGPRDASSNRYEFGPAVEMEILRGQYVNLATAQKVDAAVVAARPSATGPQFQTWLADNNVDLFYDSILSVKRWVQVAMANAMVSGVPSALANWDSLSADQVAEALTIGQAASAHIIAQYENRPQPDGRTWLPSRFKTRGGQMGLLQIVRMPGDGTSVRVRWKLIQARAASSQPGAQPAATPPATQPAEQAHRAAPGDIIRIRVLEIHTDDPNIDRRIAENGDIDVPLLTKPINVLGASRDEIVDIVTKTYQREGVLKDPVITAWFLQTSAATGKGAAASLSVELGKGPGPVLDIWNVSEGVSVSGDGQRVAAARGNTAYVLDLATGREIKRLDLSNRGEAVTLSPDGKLLATNRGTVLDIATGKEVTKLALDGWMFHHPEFSADGSVMGINTGRNYYLFDTTTWKPLRVLKSPTPAEIDGFSRSMLSGDGRCVLLDRGQPAPHAPVPPPRRKEAAGVWDVATGKRLLARRSGASLSHDGGLLACADGNEVEVVEVRSGRAVWKRKFEAQEKARAITAISPAGDLVAVNIEGPGDSVHGISLYDPHSDKFVGQLAGADQSLHLLRFSRDGRLLIGYCELVVGESRIWRVADAVRRAASQEADRPVGSAAGDDVLWSKTVNGLQCRLLALKDRPTRTWQKDANGTMREVELLRDQPAIEIRNVSDRAIYVPLWRDELPILSFSIKSHPDLRSPTTYGDAWPEPHLLKPGQVYRRQLAGTYSSYLIGYGRKEPGKKWEVFDGQGKTYEVSAVMEWDRKQLARGSGGSDKVDVWTGSLTTNTVRISLGLASVVQAAGNEQDVVLKPNDPLTAMPGKTAASRPATGAAEIERLIRELGSEKFADREAAQKALREIGKPALVLLAGAVEDKDPERANRAALLVAELAVPTLTLSVQQAELLPYEPVRVTVRLRNDCPIPIPRPPGLILRSAGTVRFQVRKDNEEFRPFHHRSIWPHADGERGKGTIEPGAEESYEDTLSHGWDSQARTRRLYLLPAPGQYQLKAAIVLEGDRPFVESPAVNLIVKEPQGDDAEALALIRKHVESEDFFAGTYLHAVSAQRWAEPVQVLKEVVQRYPKSGYAKYAAYVLSAYFRVGKGGTRAEAAEMLKKVLDYPKSWLTPCALGDLVSHYTGEARFDEAQRWLSKLEGVCPNHPDLHYLRYTLANAKANTDPKTTHPASDAASPEPAAIHPADEWGKANNGVQARLRADKHTWAAGQTPTFKADIRNQGKGEYTVAQAQQLSQLELDGARYRWTGDISVKSSALPPGREYKGITISLTDNWVKMNPGPRGISLPDGEKLRLGPGKHNLRVIFLPDGGSSRKNLVVESNAVEFEVASPAATQPAEAKGVRVTGRVLDTPGGKGLPGATVTLWHGLTGNLRSTTTGKDGSYTFGNVASHTHIQGVTLQLPPGVWSQGRTASFHVGEADIRAADLYARTGQTVSGTIREATTGQPAGGARIDVSGDWFASDAQGHYTLHVLPGKVKVTCFGTEERYYVPETVPTKSVTAEPGTRSDSVNFTVRSAKQFVGRVTLPDGKAAAGVDVAVLIDWKDPIEPYGEGWRTTRNPPTNLHLRLTTDAEGKFYAHFRRPRLILDPPLHYRGVKVTVVATTTDRAIGIATEINADGDEPDLQMIAMELGKAASLTARLVDGQGKGIAGATFYAGRLQRKGPMYGMRDDEGVTTKYLGDGHYRLEGLVPGAQYHFQLQAPGYTSKRVYLNGNPGVFRLSPGELRDMGTMRLGPLNPPPATQPDTGAETAMAAQCANGPTSASQPANAQVQTEWSAPQEGVQLRLRAARKTWRADEIPALRWDVRNVGTRKFLHVGDGQRLAQLEVDGVWHQWPAGLRSAREADLGAGAWLEDQLLTVSPIWSRAKPEDLQWRQNGAIDMDPAEAWPALQLAPGQHGIRLAVIAAPSRADTGDGFRVVSQPLDITIETLPAGQTASWPPGPRLGQAAKEAVYWIHLVLQESLRPGRPEMKEWIAKALAAAKQAAALGGNTPLHASIKPMVDALVAVQQAVEKDPAGAANEFLAAGTAYGNLVRVFAGETPPATQPAATQPAATQPGGKGSVDERLQGLWVALGPNHVPSAEPAAQPTTQPAGWGKP